MAHAMAQKRVPSGTPAPRPTATPPDADRSGLTRVTHDHTRPHRTSRYMLTCDVISRPLPRTHAAGSSHRTVDRSDARRCESPRKLCEGEGAIPGRGRKPTARRGAFVPTSRGVRGTAILLVTVVRPPTADSPLHAGSAQSTKIVSAPRPRLASGDHSRVGCAAQRAHTMRA